MKGLFTFRPSKPLKTSYFIFIFIVIILLVYLLLLFILLFYFVQNLFVELLIMLLFYDTLFICFLKLAGLDFSMKASRTALFIDLVDPDNYAAAVSLVFAFSPTFIKQCFTRQKLATSRINSLILWLLVAPSTLVLHGPVHSLVYQLIVLYFRYHPLTKTVRSADNELTPTLFSVQQHV